MIEQTHYSEWPLAMEATYKGRCSSMSPEEVAAMVLEGLRFFGLDDPLELPPPPSGLVGVEKGYSQTALKTTRHGLYYILALLDKSPRSQWNSFSAISDILKQQYHEGKKAAEKHYFDLIADGAISATNSIVDMRGEQKVYFIGSDEGPIKIGIALCPETRLKGLQTASPAKLNIMAVCDGGLQQEQSYHKWFADYRLQGEWFERHPDILAEIERLTNTPTQQDRSLS